MDGNLVRLAGCVKTSQDKLQSKKNQLGVRFFLNI